MAQLVQERKGANFHFKLDLNLPRSAAVRVHPPGGCFFSVIPVLLIWLTRIHNGGSQHRQYRSSSHPPLPSGTSRPSFTTTTGSARPLSPPPCQRWAIAAIW